MSSAWAPKQSNLSGPAAGSLMLSECIAGRREKCPGLIFPATESTAKRSACAHSRRMCPAISSHRDAAALSAILRREANNVCPTGDYGLRWSAAALQGPQGYISVRWSRSCTGATGREFLTHCSAAVQPERRSGPCSAAWRSVNLLLPQARRRRGPGTEAVQPCLQTGQTVPMREGLGRIHASPGHRT